ncbi:SMP-30/gluconolactonase/LRE family protein [Roseiarcaceae bacterium H3SJ34-1]|uniref:SMP-30/gluconolactonase/LRE family protein n=1 Tax=Terripilifer ovatus TaxID=3032367 RepID=UPI003AB923B1|nr:SMP-30/gluconolactonase/LRE family protein [Roseiarcaceae bacterium H3SJ34-1]
MLRRAIIVLTGLILLVAGYLALWPVPASPVAWSASKAPGFEGPFAPNQRLAGLRMIPIGKEYGPEHIALGPDGKFYAAMTSGALLRFEADGGNQQPVANTDGRVLGIAFDPGGRMIVADAMRGLLAVGAEGQITVLADHVTPDDPIRYANALTVGPDGTVYLSDSSTRFSPREWGDTYRASVLDIMEQSGTGRVLAYDPGTGKVRIVAHGLSFANGIALSTDGRWLFVSETGRYRVWKIATDARDVDVASGSPQASVLLDNLPGYPDNLTRGSEGRLWLGLFRPRNPAADSLAPYPFVRKVLLRLPRWMLPLGKPYGHVFAFDEQGRIVASLQDPAGAYPETTGATEAAGRLYIHSLHAPTIGWLPL